MSTICIRIKHRIKIPAKKSRYLEVDEIRERCQKTVSIRISVGSVERRKSYTLLSHEDLGLGKTTSVIPPNLVELMSGGNKDGCTYSLIGDRRRCHCVPRTFEPGTEGGVR